MKKPVKPVAQTDKLSPKAHKNNALTQEYYVLRNDVFSFLGIFTASANRQTAEA